MSGTRGPEGEDYEPPKGSRTVWTAIEYIVTVSGWLGSAAIAFLAFTVVLNVAVRYAGVGSIPGILDLVAYWWMPPLALFGMVVAEDNDEHIQVTFVTDRIRNPRIRDGLIAFESILVVVFLGVTCIYSWSDASNQMELGEQALAGFATWPTRYSLPVAFGFFAISLGAKTLQHVMRAISYEGSLDSWNQYGE